MKGFNVLEEGENHFTLKHPNGHEVKVAKKGLSESTVNKLRGFAEGGQVYGASKENTLDPDKASAFRQGFGGGQPDPKPEQPKVQNPQQGTKVAKYADGGEVAETQAPEINLGQPQEAPTPNEIQQANTKRNPASTSQEVANFIGKHGVAPVIQGLKDTVGAYKTVGQGVGNFAHSIAEGAGLTSPEPAPGMQNAAMSSGQAPQFQNVALPGGQQGAQSQQFPDFMKAYTEPTKQVIQGIGQQAEAQQQQAQAQQQAYQQQEKQAQDLMAFHQERLQSLDKENEALKQDVLNSHVNPSHLWQDKSGFGKVSTAIGLVLGGMGAGLTGGENPALKFLNSQIDRDIEAQKSNLGNKKTLLENNLREYGNLEAATAATRLNLLAVTEAKLGQAAAQAGSPMAKAKAMEAIGQLKLQQAPLMNQIAVMQTAMKGGSQGANPAMMIRYLVPEHQQVEANKEMSALQNLKAGGENAIQAFDKVSNMAGNGLLSPNQKAALIQPVIAQLSKETAGRFTETDSKFLESLFPKPTDGPGTTRLKRQQLIKLLGEKMHSSVLEGNFIPVPKLNTSQPIQGNLNFKQVGMTK